MYGWTFAIEDTASGTLNAITQNMKATIATATVAKESVSNVLATTKTASIGGGLAQMSDTLAGTPALAKTASERIGDIVTATLNVKRAYDYLSIPLENLPIAWQEIRGEIVTTATALAKGDWLAAGQSIGAGLDVAMSSINSFRTTWQFAQEDFAGAKTIFSETWAVLSGGAMNAVTAVRSFGTTVLTQTLPSLLTFVGRGVTAVAGFVLELVGATGAQAALNAVMSANPIGLIVVGIVAVGAAVAGLIYYWDEVKTWLVGFANFMIENNPFMWIVNLTDKIFPGFKAAVQDVFKSIFGWIDTWFIQPISKVMSWLSDTVIGISNDVNAALSPVADVSQETTDYYKNLYGIKDQKPVAFGTASESTGETLSNLTDKGGKTTAKKASLGIAKANSIEGGGGQIKNINIRIDKLVEKIENHFENGNQMDERKIRDVITRALVDGVNDFNRQ